MSTPGMKKGNRSASAAVHGPSSGSRLAVGVADLARPGWPWHRWSPQERPPTGHTLTSHLADWPSQGLEAAWELGFSSSGLWADRGV